MFHQRLINQNLNKMGNAYPRTLTEGCELLSLPLKRQGAGNQDDDPFKKQLNIVSRNESQSGAGGGYRRVIGDN